MIVGSFLSPALTFTIAAILLLVSIVSFVLFIKINRRNKKIFDTRLMEYNHIVERIKQQEEEKAKLNKKPAPERRPAVAEKKPVAEVKPAPAKNTGRNIADAPRRIQFMAPNGASYDVPMFDSLTIGSDPNSDLFVDNPTVAKAQCKILYSGGKYMIEDLGSEDGTYVDGNRVPTNSTIEVKTGVLQMGKVTFFMTIG